MDDDLYYDLILYDKRLGQLIMVDADGQLCKVPALDFMAGKVSKGHRIATKEDVANVISERKRRADEATQQAAAAAEAYVYSAGTLLALTWGEYSDHTFVGLVRVLKPLSIKEIGTSNSSNGGDAMARLINGGWVEEVDCEEVSLGD